MKKTAVVVSMMGSCLLAGATLAFAGDLEVTVVAADGKKIREGVIYASDQAVKIESGGGKTIIRGIPEQRTAVTADVRVGKGGGRTTCAISAWRRAFRPGGLPTP